MVVAAILFYDVHAWNRCFMTTFYVDLGTANRRETAIPCFVTEQTRQKRLASASSRSPIPEALPLSFSPTGHRSLATGHSSATALHPLHQILLITDARSAMWNTKFDGALQK